MRVRAAVVLAVAAVFPRLALARPAVVRVFEAAARAAPAPDAPVVRRFPERAELSVSEEAKDGWRQVRLPDGGAAWIEDSALSLRDPPAAPSPPAAAPPLPPASPPPPPQPDLHPRLVVEDAAQLPRLMQQDPAFAEKANALASRQTLSWISAGVGVVASLAFAIAAANNMSGPPPGSPDFGKTPDGANYALAGVASLAIGGLVSWAVYPSRGEVVDLVNGWNLAHPDAPLEVQPLPVVVVAQRSPGSLDSEPAFGASSADVGPRFVMPTTGGPPELAQPLGGGVYLPVTGGPPVLGAPVD